jgi:hypothetical protein
MSTMNQMIVDAARRRAGRPIRDLARLGVSPTGDTAASEDRQETLNRLLADEEDARRAGDADELAVVEAKIGALFDEAREAAAERHAASIAFDGGVRLGARLPAPASGSHAQPTAADLMLQAMTVSREESQQRKARGLS